MRWIVALRGCKWGLGAIWSQCLLIAGFYLWTQVSGFSLPGLCLVAMGEFVVMYMLLDDWVQPVQADVVNFLKLTAALVFFLSAAFVLWHWQAMLFG